ncbi:carbonic anhydrase [Auriculariales sp. MPI-PUGE-AT-0066]|nr:carbonic anhydrase [Auriculariales sp. MPI-PUGE-AT-0066]
MANVLPAQNSNIDPAVPDFPSDPENKFIFITCMDSRIDPARIFGDRWPGPGRVHVLRNAGGRTPETLRSILVSQNVVQPNSRQIWVMHHTKCGMLGVSNDRLREIISEQRPDHVRTVGAMYFAPLKGEVKNEEPVTEPPSREQVVQALRNDIEFLKEQLVVRQDRFVGLVYDVDSNKVELVYDSAPNSKSGTSE